MSPRSDRAVYQVIFERLQDFESRDFLTITEETGSKFTALLDAIPYGPVGMYIDGLDECPEEESRALIEFLCKFCQKGCPRIKLMITSRPEKWLNEKLEAGKKGLPFSELDTPQEKIHADITMYISVKLRPNIDVLVRGENQMVRDGEFMKIQTELGARTSGLGCTFIWAYFFVDILLEADLVEKMHTYLTGDLSKGR
ncbi:hypothetical protein DL95DRAFT_449935 [Leptodontidium sp. 2 PMI_412]|nr:hypothetical protein DL95DRAFT_449935 [Leptodontidium sp. 2 PMI_412]